MLICRMTCEVWKLEFDMRRCSKRLQALQVPLLQLEVEVSP